MFTKPTNTAAAVWVCVAARAVDAVASGDVEDAGANGAAVRPLPRGRRAQRARRVALGASRAPEQRAVLGDAQTTPPPGRSRRTAQRYRPARGCGVNSFLCSH